MKDLSHRAFGESWTGTRASWTVTRAIVFSLRCGGLAAKSPRGARSQRGLGWAAKTAYSTTSPPGNEPAYQRNSGHLPTMEKAVVQSIFLRLGHKDNPDAIAHLLGSKQASRASFCQAPDAQAMTVAIDTVDPFRLPLLSAVRIDDGAPVQSADIESRGYLTRSPRPGRHKDPGERRPIDWLKLTCSWS